MKSFKSTSPKLQLNQIDLVKICMGALMAVIGALLTYITQVITGIDWGIWSGLLMPFWSIVANGIRKWMSNYTTEE